MGYNVSQSLGEHDVSVEKVEVIDKDGDGTNIIVAVSVRFQDAEVGQKDLYPSKSEKALQLTRKSLKAMGFDIDKNPIDDLNVNPKLVVGAKVRVTVEENVWNGNVTNRIGFINAIPKPPSKERMAELTKKLRNVKNDNAENEL